MDKKPTLVPSVLHDLVDVVPRRDGRGDAIRVQDGDMSVASPGEVERNRAAPGAGADNEDGGIMIQLSR